ncbi:MAG: hypothetical protein V7K95_25930 [Nostoc sp.]
MTFPNFVEMTTNAQQVLDIVQNALVDQVTDFRCPKILYYLVG